MLKCLVMRQIHHYTRDISKTISVWLKEEYQFRPIRFLCILYIGVCLSVGRPHWGPLICTSRNSQPSRYNVPLSDYKILIGPQYCNVVYSSAHISLELGSKCRFGLPDDNLSDFAHFSEYFSLEPRFGCTLRTRGQYISNIKTSIPM